MKRILSIIIISLLFVTPSFAESTQEILLACKSFFNNTNHREDGKILIPTTYYDSGICWGAFSVIQSLLYLHEEDGTPTFKACVPKEVTRDQLISVFVKHAEGNPQLLHQSFAPTAINCIIDVFPCKKTNLKEQKKKPKK